VEAIYKMFLKSIMISGFVFIMMLVIEYINVQSRGIWQKHLTENKWKQYLIVGLLGAIPGCLGAFTVVTLFTHRLVSFGALVTAMIATSGDEALAQETSCRGTGFTSQVKPMRSRGFKYMVRYCCLNY